MNKGAAILLLFVIVLAYSCRTTNMTNYYEKHKSILDSMQSSYKEQFKSVPFSIAFTDKSYQNFGIEITTDSIKYIYEFKVTEQDRLKDTLLKYHLSVPGVQTLLTSMQLIRCAWINRLDYYVDEKKNSLVYMSIKARAFNYPFTSKKYYIITYFSKPQYYDEQGRLLINRKQRKLQRINNDVFRRINDRVCYSISNLFR
ncbi:MAG: hypothetical protein ABJA78_12865 [Ferruginibacter sp.]